MTARRSVGYGWAPRLVQAFIEVRAGLGREPDQAVGVEHSALDHIGVRAVQPEFIDERRHLATQDVRELPRAEFAHLDRRGARQIEGLQIPSGKPSSIPSGSLAGVLSAPMYQSPRRADAG